MLDRAANLYYATEKKSLSFERTGGQTADYGAAVLTNKSLEPGTLGGRGQLP